MNIYHSCPLPYNNAGPCMYVCVCVCVFKTFESGISATITSHPHPCPNYKYFSNVLSISVCLMSHSDATIRNDEILTKCKEDGK